MAICVPVRELKNTSAFTRTVQDADGPVYVTKNGTAAFVSLSTEAFEALEQEAARSHLYAAIDRAESDIEAGRVRNGHKVIAELRERYGL